MILMSKLSKFVDGHKVLRIFIYILQIFILFSFQQVPGIIPEVSGGRPNLVVSLFLAIALFEGNYVSLVWGLISGLILDLSLGKYIGLNMAILGIIGYAVGKIKEKLFEVRLVTYIFFCLIMHPILIFIGFYTTYIINGFDFIDFAISNHVIPSIVYTILVSPLIYLFNRPIFYLLREKGGVGN